MRKKDEALRETLLECASDIVCREGPDAVNIRSIAARAGVATGTVYNYFADKEDILLALTERHWQAAIEKMRVAISDGSFEARLGEMYAFLRGLVAHSAGKLMGSLSLEKPEGRRRMQAMLKALHPLLIDWMEQDADVREGVWDGVFTRERCAEFIVANLMERLRAGAEDLDFFMMVVKRTLY